MQFRQIYCCICGAPIFELDAEGSPWLWDLRYVISQSDLESPEESGRKVPSDVPFLTPKGSLVDTDDGILSAQVFDSSSGEYIQPRFHIPPAFTELENISYPIHEGCWKILSILLGGSDVARPGIETVSLHEKMSTFRQILENTSSHTFGWRLLWPHRYYETPSRPYQTDTWTPMPEVRYMEADPWMADDIPTLQRIASIKDQHQKSLSVPHILPLPVELSQRIYSYLDWSDIANLLLLKATVEIQIPSSYWRSLFQTRAEFGYFHLDETSKISQDLSQFQKFCIARKEQIQQPDAAKNRRRIWKICKALADQIIDISSCQIRGLDGPLNILGSFHTIPETSPPKPNLWVYSEGYLHDGLETGNHVFLGSRSIYSGELDVDFIEGLLLSYAGSGSMSFLSGITVLPSGKQLGYITPKTRLVPWAPNSVLSVMTSKYGIVDISISSTVEKPSWRPADEGSRDRRLALKYRILGDNIGPVKIQGRWDVSRMTEIRITTSQILDDQSLNSETESFLQNHAWTPDIPPSNLNINPSLYSGAPFIWAGSPRYCPLQYVLFPVSSPLTLITSWASGLRISGLTFHFKGHSPITLGETRGTPVDFLVDGEEGEEIASIHALLHKEHRDSLCGVVIEMNTKRQALFCIEELENCYSRSILTPQSSKLIGLYGASRDFRLYTYELSSIGVITHSQTDANLEAPDSFDMGDLRVENATYVAHLSRRMVKSEDCARHGNYHYLCHSLHFGRLKQFASTATLEHCYRIVFYKQDNPWPRIVGMKLYYKENFGQSESSRILGRISDGVQEPESLELPENGGVFIRRLGIFVGEQSPRPSGSRTHVNGLELHLTNSKVLFWGAAGVKRDPSPHKCLWLEPDSTLRWDYNAEFDIISFVDKEEEEEEEEEQEEEQEEEHAGGGLITTDSLG
ncbi:hypothetical protein TWF718_007562 [Orbilia javanica]|uniref:F-box domain-containing protein n=1 Tax=Orbilia javanica TaxID=47235 RepID=A0AAN8NWC6_9PEZI